MHRRTFVKTLAGTVLVSGIPRFIRTSAAAEMLRVDNDLFSKLADIALSTAKKHGAAYCDLRVCFYETEQLSSREERVEHIDSTTDAGCGVRVLKNGAWGFASSSRLTASAVESAAKQAVALAEASRAIQKRPVELEKLPAYNDKWTMPMQIDPFTISAEKKASALLAINAAAKTAGADFCSSSFLFVKETKQFASSYGSRIEQTRVRCSPDFKVTAVDKKTGKFESRSSLAAPRGSGYEYIESYDFLTEAGKAAEEARAKFEAKSVEPGRKDLVIHPTNLWLTIHESIGHPTELDRALGYEANFAGTSFVTTDKLGKLKYGSKFITIRGDRSQANGLSTVAYDDDGVKTAGAEFDIIKNGKFENYQMALGQAALIGRKHSNGCAFADSYDKFPIQRMPNVSLQPSEKDVSLDELISEVKDGIYIMGDGSWSIDQQRYNFQFGGQVFYEIKEGKLGAMLRDVAYQANTVNFWNACDGICGASEYFLGGAMNCGKGQPEQAAPVSHGAVPARFRNVNILNTSRKDIAS
ncbi:MAG: TldD/PmbA family protein [Verrucomicrobiota bacterium]|nr:TldD/PmbA family protein [Verrucomicrobiota bacterium]